MLREKLAERQGLLGPAASPLRGRRLPPTLSHACGARLEPKGPHRASLQRIYQRPRAGPLIYGGERGIRTLDGLLTHTPLAGARLQPLGHLSRKQIVQLLFPAVDQTPVGITRPVGLAPSGPPPLRGDVVSRLRRSARTLDGLLTHTPLAGARVTSGFLPSALPGQRRYAPLLQIAPGDLLSHSAISP